MEYIGSILGGLVFGSILGNRNKPAPVPTPEPPKPMPIADDTAVAQARKRNLQRQIAGRGRASTILSQGVGDALDQQLGS